MTITNLNPDTSISSNLQTHFMREAIRLSRQKMRAGEGGPFGAVVVRNGKIVGRGWNRVIAANDPTAHAEIMAIRNACKKLKRFHLPDCALYTSCEPCPMCLAAVYWAQMKEVFYANTRRDAAAIGFNDVLVYHEISLPIPRRKIPMKPLLRRESLPVFAEWGKKDDRVVY